MKKKLISILLVLCMIISLAPVVLAAETDADTTEDCKVTWTYPTELCNVAVYTLLDTDGNGLSDEKTQLDTDAAIPAGTWVSFEISNITAGYRIKSVTMNGKDYTSGFVNGGYGILGMTIQADTAITVELETIPDPLPTIAGVELYLDEDCTQSAGDMTVDGSTRFYAKAAYSDGVDHPNYYIGGKWEFSTDGKTWQTARTWGSNRYDFWPGWSYHNELDFVNASYYLRVRIQPNDLYTIGDDVLSNAIHINGDAETGCTHQWGEWEEATAATCTDEGEQTRTCNECQETQTQTIPALGHQLTYAQSDAGFTQSCAREGCGHTASATLSAVDGVYTGAAQENVTVTCDDGWVGGVPSITYANHVNAGTATATVAIGDVSVSVEFQIAKASSHTLTLGNLSQVSGSVSAVTWNVAPADSTAQVSVEYQVPVSAAPCGHVHDESCGENGESCAHQHDETCGYQEAGTEWTTALPTEVGSYPVRVRLTGSDNLELAAAEDYTTGTLTIRAKSSGSSGGSTSSSNTTTKTTTNSDGSKTTTVTDTKTGTVTENTKYADGSTLVVVTETDGAVTTTETAANGVEVKTVDKPGAEVTSTVKIPQNVGKTTVTIPAEVNYGMVAVDAETGEIVKLSVPTENGMLVKLDGSAELVLMDKAKGFTDTTSHWAKDAIDFVSAHEMFAGTSATTFSPDASMTRGMLMTVLARFDGQDTSGGSVWYEKGMEWAKANGVSDGSNPDDSITREQFATMLWRYAGSHAASGSLTDFSDHGSVSGYATDAMRWAVETGIINGMDDGTLSPQGSATRAQVVTMLMRFVENLTK